MPVYAYLSRAISVKIMPIIHWMFNYWLEQYFEGNILYEIAIKLDKKYLVITYKLRFKNNICEL